MAYHESVLLKECIEGLAIKPDGIYVDVTFGGGGHSKAIMECLGDGGRLIAFDQDTDALANAFDDKRLTLVHANFADLKKFLRLHGITKVDGILADLGVSSYQFDTAGRGFSYRFDGPLDMRMNQQAGQSASDVLNTYGEDALVNMFSEYGEVPNSKRLAKAVIEKRIIAHFDTIQSLMDLLQTTIIGDRWKYLSQVFQAIRMEVNQETNVLKSFLEQCGEVLKEDGRLAVITFHSIEDRLVKQYMKNGVFEDEPKKDMYGRFYAPFKVITKKPIVATAEEQKGNTRSRSAKLRIGAKKREE
jgi:16S rRNA (cytosine1402-N4)-methyltransferase